MDLAFDVDSFFASSQEIKRDMSEEEEKLVVAPKRKGSKRALDADETEKRNVRRRENQKVACRNYRMRKKEYLTELKTKIQQLEAEKERLTKENMTHKMKGSSAVDPAIVSILNEMARILAELENSIKMNAEERVAEYLLQAFFIAAGKLHNANMKDIEELVNPFTQASLVNMGYIPSMEFPEVSPINIGSWWEPFATAANLSPDQCNKMQDIIGKLCKRDLELRMERGVIDKQIKQFYLNKLMVFPLVSNPISPVEQLDTKTILDFTWLLNRLKANIITQKSLLLNTQPAMSAVLSPKQHALLVINVCQSRVFEWPYHAQTLRAAWDLVSRSENTPPATPLSPSPPASPSSSPNSPYYSSQSLSPSPSPPPTVVPSIAIPTPLSAYPPPSFAFNPHSPTLTSTCTSQLPGAQLTSSFLSSLNYGVH